MAAFNVGDRARFAHAKSPYAKRFVDATGFIEQVEGDWRWLQFDAPLDGGVLHRQMLGCWALADELEAVK